MKDVDEDANSELIARLLMEDQLSVNHQDNPYDDEEDDEDDFVPEAVIKNAKKRQGRGTRATASPTSRKRNDDEENPKQRKRRAVKEKQLKEGEPRIKRWTDEEEEKFIEALSLFGREWSKASTHIGTRDVPAIKSHAQKYFIKLYKLKQPLPDKVRESGDGHTLSGKPLDPDSGAARQYLGAKYREERDKEKKDILKQESKNEASKEAEKNGEKQDANPETTESQTGEKRKAADEKDDSKKKKKKTPFREKDLNLDQADYQIRGGKSYKENLREAQLSINYSQINGNTDPLTMVKCQHFTGEVASGSAVAQPFSVRMNSNALLVCDFHAHLASTEIIGFLAGTWDPESKVVTVQDSFPCKSLLGDSNNVSVEMDPHSELVVREKIKAKGYRVVGWYHSHPVFQPDPSLRDIENQTNYQFLFKDEENNVQPFIGVIVGPYDIRMKTEESTINYFYVRSIKDEKNGQPMLVEKDIFFEDISTEIHQTMDELIEEYKNFPARINFSDLWRYCSPLEKDKKIEIDPTTKIQKLQKAMKYRVSHLKDEAAIFSEKLISKLKESWKIEE